MGILTTAFAHFNDDIARAYALLEHAESLPDGTLKDDVLRAATMMSVGASDAYFSDAYTDLVARMLRAMRLQIDIAVASGIETVTLPIGTFARGANDGWAFRNVARQLMANESILSFQQIRGLFNKFYNQNSKMLSDKMIENWILTLSPKQRLFGTTKYKYLSLSSSLRRKELKNAKTKFIERFQVLYQRRHDCIHNCDRVKERPMKISVNFSKKCIQDFEFLVGQINEELNNQFGLFLQELGFSAATRNSVT